MIAFALFSLIQLTSNSIAMADSPVVLWNELGSDDEVLNSEVGPNLEFYDPSVHGTTGCCDEIGSRSYVSGVFGDGVMLSGGPYYVVSRIHNIVLSNLASYISPEQGTIAVWYKQINPPVAYLRNIYRIFDGAFGLGSGMGFMDQDPQGLSFGLGFGGTYTQINTDISSYNNSWIHIAAVWDRNGINGSSDAMRLYIDGVIAASTNQNNWGTTVGNFADICGSNDDDENFVMDNLVIYDFAKTDFLVGFDIKPGSCPNALNVKKKGVLPVAILGAEEFDVYEIDPASVRLTLNGNGDGVPSLRSAYEDVATPFKPYNEKSDCDQDCTTDREDGYLDLTLKFDAQEIIGLIPEEDKNHKECIVFRVDGMLTNGEFFYGKDVVMLNSK
jgi:hypothetical protein